MNITNMFAELLWTSVRIGTKHIPFIQLDDLYKSDLTEGFGDCTTNECHYPMSKNLNKPPYDSSELKFPIQASDDVENERIDRVEQNGLHHSSLEDVGLENNLKWKTAKYPAYSDAKNRLATYRGWPLAEPNPNTLSTVGFFFTGHDYDLVRCFCCGIGLKDFSDSDNPLLEHAKHSSNCPFINDHFGSREALEAYKQRFTTQDPEEIRRRQRELYERQQDRPKAIYRAKHEHFRTFESRLGTFTHWPQHLSQRPKELADAGMYYTGHDYDLVRCFCCGIGLKDFSDSDNPLLEHAKHSSNCPFIIDYFGSREALEAYKQRFSAQDPEEIRRRQRELYERQQGRPVTIYRAKHERFLTTESRLGTFTHWPQHLSQRPKELADAGMYYTGHDYDDPFSDSDDPLLEHAKHSSNCPFIIDYFRSPAALEAYKQRFATQDPEEITRRQLDPYERHRVNWWGEMSSKFGELLKLLVLAAVYICLIFTTNGRKVSILKIVITAKTVRIRLLCGGIEPNPGPDALMLKVVMDSNTLTQLQNKNMPRERRRLLDNCLHAMQTYKPNISSVLYVRCITKNDAEVYIILCNDVLNHLLNYMPFLAIFPQRFPASFLVNRDENTTKCYSLSRDDNVMCSIVFDGLNELIDTTECERIHFDGGDLNVYTQILRPPQNHVYHNKLQFTERDY